MGKVIHTKWAFSRYMVMVNFHFHQSKREKKKKRNPNELDGKFPHFSAIHRPTRAQFSMYLTKKYRDWTQNNLHLNKLKLCMCCFYGRFDANGIEWHGSISIPKRFYTIRLILWYRRYRYTQINVTKKSDIYLNGCYRFGFN